MRGVLIALAILGLWVTCLVLLLALPFAGAARWLAVPLGLLMAFLYSGVFITAHDAVHGSVCPQDRRLNDAIGRFAAAGFALFSFKRLSEAHWKHHRSPASTDDPDYHDGRKQGFVRWYLRFMRAYLRPSQLAGLAAVFTLLRHGLGVPLFNVLAFWVAPPLASSAQLFYFGTYLPHREPPSGYHDRHRTVSNKLPPLLSFLACYHFGYHHEHHRDPRAPWWQLPRLRWGEARTSASGTW